MPDAASFPAEPPSRSRGEGRLSLTFDRSQEGRSYLAEQFATYPFHVCRAQYPDHELPDMTSLYLQSCSGGVFEGDRLSAEFQVREGARAHVATQASTIVHRMDRQAARQTTRIAVEHGALFEFLPDATILFPGSRLSSSVVASCADAGDMIVGESFLCHDPDGAGQTFGLYESELVIRRPAGETLAVDRFSISGETFSEGEIAADAVRYPVHGTFAVVTSRVDPPELRQSLRAAMCMHGGIYAGASLMPGNSGVWVRYMATDGVAAKALVCAMWSAARLALTGAAPTLRRK